MAQRWPLPIAPLGAASCGVALWRWRGQLLASAVVKASWSFASGVLARCDPEPIYRELGDGPDRPAHASSDLAPYLGRADVWVAGHQPSSGPGAGDGPRLALWGGQTPLDKRARHSSDAFGLIGPNDPRRAVLMRSDWRSALACELIELPDDFTWEVLHAAPPDQRVPYLHGGEVLTLEGLSPRRHHLQLTLPRVVGRAWTHDAADPHAPTPLALQIDGLGIDVESERLTLRWRGCFAIGAAGPSAYRVSAGIDSGDDAFAQARAHVTASTDTRVTLRSATDEPRPAPSRRRRGTVKASAEDVAAMGQAMPFAAAQPVDAPVRLQRVSAGTLPMRDQPSSTRGTLPFDKSSAPLRSAVALESLRLRDVPGAPFSISAAPAAIRPANSRVTIDVASERRSIVPVVNATRAAAVAFPWPRLTGQPSLVMVAKATFEIVPGHAARWSAAPDALCGDVHVSPKLARRPAHVERSLRYPSDFAAEKRRADVVLVGRAYAPGGSGGAALVELSFGGRDGFKRRIAVFGDRVWESSLMQTAPSAPSKFSSLPLIYERAFGGRELASNPVGVGYGGAGKPRPGSPLPNLENPDELIKQPTAWLQPAGLGPISKHWGAGEHRSRMPWDGGFPANFDWSTFQVAPVEQRLERIVGDERFECVATHPKLPRFEAWLPGLRLRGFRAARGFEELPLMLDTVVIDSERMKLHLVWRHRFDVSDDRASEIRALYLACEPLDQAPQTIAEHHARYLSARA